MEEKISAVALADLLALGARSITDLTKRGILVRAGKGPGYDLRKSVRGYCEHLRELATGRGGEGAITSATAERARLAREQADHIAIKNAQARGELIEAAAVERAWTDVLRGVRAGMLAVALLIQNDLARSLPRAVAAMIVRAYFDVWATAVARVEHRGEPVIFGVGEVRERQWWVAAGRAEQLPAFLASQPPLRRFVEVNVAALLAEMYERARAAGLDLSAGSFFLPPDDPLFLKWMAEFRQSRERAIAQFDPTDIKAPPPPTARLVASIGGASAAMH